MDKTIIHIGIDDTDTPSGGCTTHLASLLLIKLIEKFNAQPIDYPNIVRLNPAIPWKTRGNGSVVLRLMVNYRDVDDVFDTSVNFIYDYLNEYSKDWGRHSNPALAVLIGDIPWEIFWFGSKALYDVVPLRIVEKTLGKLRNLRFKVFSNNYRGLIGCLGGIGNRMLNTDYTYELIAYRDPSFIGYERLVNGESVRAMDEQFSEHTILNYDYEVDKPLITPKGPDPVLVGVRGEDPVKIFEAFKTLKIDEPIPLVVVFRTNQHTDAHLKHVSSLAEVYPYMGVKTTVLAVTKPRRVTGGHVFFKVSDGCNEIDVAVYEPTGWFRSIVEEVEPGDKLVVMGSTRPMSSTHGLTLNLEKICVEEVKPIVTYENPKCPKCGSRLKSAGVGKGFKCVKCGFKDPVLKKTVKIVERSLKPGCYEPPPRVFKHLMKPLKRFGREKKEFPEVFRPTRFIWVNNLHLFM